MNFERRVAKVVFKFQQKWKRTKIFIFHFQILRKMNWHSGTHIPWELSLHTEPAPEIFEFVPLIGQKNQSFSATQVRI